VVQKIWDSLLAEKMRKHEQTGRPLGGESFVARLENILERMLMPQKPGPKPKKVQKTLSDERR